MRLATLLGPGLALAACTAPPAGDAITFDVCGPIAIAPSELTPDQLASVDDALALWRGQGVAQLARVDAGTPGAVTLVMRTGAPAFHGYYDGPTATVTINVDVDDPAQRTIVIAHELGHAFGLAHVAPDQRVDLMNPGNLTVPPDDADRSALTALWGTCR